jgi:hypothetical protein
MSVSTPAALQADALVQAIGEQVAAERQALLDAAAREAAAVRQRARDKARRQLRRALAEMRATEREQVQRLRAELETAERRQQSAQATELLTRAWPRLAEALRARWQDPDARAAWIAALLAQARARLPAAGWQLRHPAGWSASETAALRAQLQAQGAIDATLQADAGLAAGLVIEVGGARLDGTPAALLADRPRAEAALLAALAAAEAAR